MSVFSVICIALTLENLKGIFYKILILIKNININVCCFQIITNQTNYFPKRKQIKVTMFIDFKVINNMTKIYNINYYLLNNTYNNHYYRKNCL